MTQLLPARGGRSWALVALLCALAFAGCGGGDEKESSGGGEAATTQSGPGKTEAQGAVDAFLQAAKDEDAQVICGLMSEDYAKRILNKPNAEFAIADCVETFEKSFNWAPLKREVEGVTVSNVVVNGETAKVELSDGETVDLERDKDRFVIDDIRQ